MIVICWFQHQDQFFINYMFGFGQKHKISAWHVFNEWGPENRLIYSFILSHQTTCRILSYLFTQICCIFFLYRIKNILEFFFFLCVRACVRVCVCAAALRSQGLHSSQVIYVSVCLPCASRVHMFVPSDATSVFQTRLIHNTPDPQHAHTHAHTYTHIYTHTHR